MAEAVPENETLPIPVESVWKRYSGEYEIPLAIVLALVAHVALFTCFAFYMRILDDPDKAPPVPIRSVAILPDGNSDGSAGQGGNSSKEDVPDQEVIQNPTTVPQYKLDEIRSKVTEWSPDLALDPDALESMAKTPNFDKLGKLDDKLRSKLLEGNGKGKGKGGGTGDNDGEGTGPGNGPGKGDGGNGDAASTRGRTLRWTILFNPVDSRDYAYQLSLLQARLLFPVSDNDLVFVPDLTKPMEHRRVGSITGFNEMFFIDDDRLSVARMANYLNLDFVPSSFIAFFPKNVEDDLAGKERAFAGRQEKEILSTKFKLSIRNGRPEFVVVDQQIRRR